MITGASATSRIRIIPGQTNAIALTAERAVQPRQTASEFAANFRLRGTDLPCSSLPALLGGELVPAVLQLLYHGHLIAC